MMAINFQGWRFEGCQQDDLSGPDRVELRLQLAWQRQEVPGGGQRGLHLQHLSGKEKNATQTSQHNLFYAHVA